MAQDHADVINGEGITRAKCLGVILVIDLTPVGTQQVTHIIVGPGAPGKHPEIPGFGHAFDLLDSARMADDLHPVVAQGAGNLGGTTVMTGHGAELADGGIDDGEKVFDITADFFAVLGKQVMGAGAQTDVRGDMPLVVFQHDIPFRSDNKIGIEPAIRKLGQLFTDAAGDGYTIHTPWQFPPVVPIPDRE